jgi:dihydropteroate synthase
MNNEFYIRKITPRCAENVIADIGFDKQYVKNAAGKYEFLLLKICNLRCPEANILKQLALSVGADAAVHREVITCKVEKSDVLLGCTISQLKELCEKLIYQPFKLKELAPLLIEQISKPLPSLTIRGNHFDWSQKTFIMGILNITPDSFSDGGKFYDINSAIEQANVMIQANVDIIDIGGETTKPFSQEVKPDEQLERILPVIQKIREFNTNIPISVDTRHSKVAREAIKAGADIVNDVSGFDWDNEMLSTVAELQVPVIIMHSLSSPDTMQAKPEYKNVVDEVFNSLYEKVQKAVEAGITQENIIIDPGIGFGKTLEHNYELIKRIAEFKSLGYPILVGVSRKSLIAKVLDLPPEEREEANIALGSYLAANGANILRVHDVEKHSKAFKVLDKVICLKNLS